MNYFKMKIAAILITFSLVSSVAFGNQIYRFSPHEIYFGPELATVAVDTHIKNIHLKGKKQFNGVRLGGVICGDHCAIGHSAEIKHSILLDYAAATHFTYVGDSIVGNRANLGAGVKCANLRLDRKEVKPGMQKFGA